MIDAQLFTSTSACIVIVYAGRTLCKLHMPANILHADINGDGVIDHVAVGSGSE
jgi:hypothetical protein